MLKILKTKELRSTTKVEGIMVQTSDKKWYAVTRLQPSRNPWFMRASLSNQTGRISMDQHIYMMRCKSKPDLQEGIDLLMKVLNGEENGPNDKLTYY